MRIAVTNWCRRIVGGTEGYLQAILLELAARGVEVGLWTEEDGPLDRAPIMMPPGAQSWCAGEQGSADALESLRHWQPDLIYGHGLRKAADEQRILDFAPSVFFAHAYQGICVSGTKTFNYPEVSACHRPFGPGCLACYYPRRCGGRNPLVALRLYREQSAAYSALTRYNRVFTHSQYVADEYRRNGLAAEVIPYTVDHPTEAEFAARFHHAPPLSIAQDATCNLVFVGRMDYLKGGDILLESLPKVAAAIKSPVRLFIAGDGPKRRRWEAHAREIRWRNPRVAIDFLGWMDRERLDRLLAQAHVAVVPSLWPEPFGKVGPEAAARGVPVAAFDVGGVREWLQDGVNGHLAPAHPPTAHGLAKAITQCVADPGHFAHLRTNCRKAAARFQMRSHADELMRLFQSVCGKSPAPS